MNETYGDGSDHPCCPKCGFCITCGDCNCKMFGLKYLKEGEWICFSKHETYKEAFDYLEYIRHNSKFPLILVDEDNKILRRVG